jgi:CMP-N-acetylneuraminic acid synthetase
VIGTDRLLALIPARGGSKRLPNKNLKKLAGRSLLEWAIKTAQGSQYIDHVIVSTDNDKIAEEAALLGLSVPFMRPDSLAHDCSKTIDVVRHAITTLEAQGEIFDYVVVLQPTSPLRTCVHIDEAIDLMKSKNGECIVSVAKSTHPTELTDTLPQDHSMGKFGENKQIKTHSQEFPERYYPNGAVYLFNVKKALEEDTVFLRHNCYAYIMSASTSIDIDDQDDFDIAEALANRNNRIVTADDVQLV